MPKIKKAYYGGMYGTSRENSPEYEGLKVNKGIEQPDPMNPNLAARLKNIRKKALSIDDYVEGILKGDINILCQAITLVREF